jgi:hypothetical protein
MTVDRLREVHQARPFRPFTMRMADGTRVRVTHPESLAYNGSGRTCIYVAPDGSSHYIDLLLVARLEVSNGAGRARRR